MKFFFVFALFMNFAGSAQAGTTAPAGFDPSKLRKVLYGKKLCAKIQGSVLKRAIGQGGGTQCDNFVLQNFPADRTSLAVAICKSPDLDGQSRSQENIVSCFETAAELIGKDTESWLYPREEVDLNKSFLEESEKCKGEIYCLKDVFKDGVTAYRQLFGNPVANGAAAAAQVRPGANPNQGAPSRNQPSSSSLMLGGPMQITANVPGLNPQGGASEAKPTAKSEADKDMDEARKRAAIRSGQRANE
jgi:hypothetical protein